MALSAGRKGLASELVDEFGYLKGEVPTGEYYTKSQTDNKFETKTHASNTYQKKTLELPLETLMGSKLTVEDSLDALNEIQKTRQPKTLSVPISMLQGSLLVPKTTVEDVIQTMDNAMTNRELTDLLTVKESAFTDLPAGVTANTNKLVKFGKIVTGVFSAGGITASAWTTFMKVPAGFEPKYPVNTLDVNEASRYYQTTSAGNVQSSGALSSNTVSFYATWITD